MPVTQVDTVAKKKAPKKSQDPSPFSSLPRKPLIFQMRGNPEWKAWAESIAEKEGDTLAKLVDRALRKFARDNGYPEPPKR